jgi:hypothetical protein
MDCCSLASALHRSLQAELFDCNSAVRQFWLVWDMFLPFAPLLKCYVFEIVSGWDGGHEMHCLLVRSVAYLIPVYHLTSRSVFRRWMLGSLGLVVGCCVLRCLFWKGTKFNEASGLRYSVFQKWHISRSDPRSTVATVRIRDGEPLTLVPCVALTEISLGTVDCRSFLC